MIENLKPKKFRNYKYDILHEVCHQILGWSCCREHMEFEVHGATKLLCAVLDIDIGDADERMEYYAGKTSHKACGRINKKFTQKSGKVKND